MSGPSLARRAALERRFDGPIPAHLLETSTERQQRVSGARRLLADMAADYRGEIWRQLAATCAAIDARNQRAADHHRRRLDAVARSLASLM
jgi:hypothetical protein